MKPAPTGNVMTMGTALICSVALDAQTLTITPSGLLTWTESATQQVVVCTESLPGLWTPSGQTIFRTPDQSSLAIELGKPSQFFGLRLGWQFRDAYDGSQAPWQVTFLALTESSKHTITSTNGTLRILGAADVSNGSFYLQPPTFAQTQVGDFHISVDVVDWPDTGTEQIIGLFSRFDGTSAYIAEFWQHCRYANRKTVLNIWDGAAGHRKVVDFSPDKDYRLVFVGATNRLTCSLYDLSDPHVSVSSVSITNSTFRRGRLGLYCSREYGPGPYGVTIDNFAVTGTKP